jgi:hypothetical protein
MLGKFLKNETNSRQSDGRHNRAAPHATGPHDYMENPSEVRLIEKNMTFLSAPEQLATMLTQCGWELSPSDEDKSHRPFVGHLSVRMRSDRYDLTGPKKAIRTCPTGFQHIAATHATRRGLWPLIRCFRIADGLNTITRRGGIGTLVLVFELRPIRRPFLRFLVMALFPCSFRIPITGKCGQSNDGGAESI